MLSAEPVLEDRVVVSPLIVELCLAQGRRLRFDAGIEATALSSRTTRRLEIDVSGTARRHSRVDT